MTTHDQVCDVGDRAPALPLQVGGHRCERGIGRRTLADCHGQAVGALVDRGDQARTRLDAVTGRAPRSDRRVDGPVGQRHLSVIAGDGDLQCRFQQVGLGSECRVDGFDGNLRGPRDIRTPVPAQPRSANNRVAASSTTARVCAACMRRSGERYRRVPDPPGTAESGSTVAIPNPRTHKFSIQPCSGDFSDAPVRARTRSRSTPFSAHCGRSDSTGRVDSRRLRYSSSVDGSGESHLTPNNLMAGQSSIELPTFQRFHCHRPGGMSSARMPAAFRRGSRRSGEHGSSTLTAVSAVSPTG